MHIYRASAAFNSGAREIELSMVGSPLVIVVEKPSKVSPGKAFSTRRTSDGCIIARVRLLREYCAKAALAAINYCHPDDIQIIQ